ncbi:hypothetical protein P170DRAFT_91991 [Aspergillus steynii IBT 23096]|uniref:Uncharacterized protein n=1 Tax=Aspergillus steynii IBT 23096 TaxID=1392250 RepID=A0A2I2GG58_9EURO|nr:uncharacterized protein P170DRAFT_91991 [Aspergillus steynii IBT 23096]PLB51866.1 hypothetical protein P170DRAFT_91991 [Aspergillus steynii IBT 23096]
MDPPPPTSRRVFQMEKCLTNHPRFSVSIRSAQIARITVNLDLEVIVGRPSCFSFLFASAALAAEGIFLPTIVRVPKILFFLSFSCHHLGVFVLHLVSESPTLPIPFLPRLDYLALITLDRDLLGAVKLRRQLKPGTRRCRVRKGSWRLSLASA